MGALTVLKAKSILTEHDDRCYICGSRQWLEEHHIFGAAKRKVSEINGFKCHLCHYCHNEPSDGVRPAGVHFDIKLDRKLKAICQAKYEETHSRAEFMQLIGKNFIYEEAI